MMPTLTAATNVRSGLPLSTRACCMRLIAWYSAANAPVIAAVRVPPSAWSTSQSSVTVRSPSIRRSTTVRRERPIRRWISCVRPPIRPVLASRWPRSWVARGSIEYSAVTQPWPEPRRCGGTRSSTLAVTHTRVRPISTSAEPSACALTPSSSLNGRSTSGRSRPSGLGTRSVAGELQEERRSLPEDVERDEDQERRERVGARRHEVGGQAQGDHPVEAVPVEPAGADDPQHAQRVEHHRQLEHDPERDRDEQDEAEQLVAERQVVHVQRRESREDPDEQGQREQRERDAEQEEEGRGHDQRQRQAPLVLVEARADERPRLPEDDRRRRDEADHERDRQAERERSRRVREVHARPLEPGSRDEQVQ